MSKPGSLVYCDCSSCSLLDQLMNINHETYGPHFGDSGIELLVWQGELYPVHASFGPICLTKLTMKGYLIPD